MRAGDKARSRGRKQLFHMRSDSIGPRRLLKRVLAPPRDLLVEKADVAGRLDIVVERLERPDDDVSVADLILDDRIGFEHEPLRPVAARLVLLREDDAQDLLDRVVMFQRKEELDRPLADIAGSPGGARVLFEPMRHRQMNHRVMREPREQRVESGALVAAALDAEVAGDSSPEAPRGQKQARVLDAMLKFGGKLFRRFGIGHRTNDGEAELAHRPRAQRQIGPVPGLPIGVEQLVAANRFEGLGGAGDQMVDRVGVALAPHRVRARTQ